MNARPNRRLASLLVFAALLFVGGCLKFPLGDPEQSKVDDRLVGGWRSDADGTLLTAVKYDPRTYVVTVYEAAKEKADAAASTDPLHPTGDVYKAWLTPLAGANFLTLQDVSAKPLMNADDTPYLVAKWELSKDEAGNDVLTCRGVNPDFVKQSDVTDTAGLTKLLTDHVNDPAAYQKDPSVYHRISTDTLHELLAPPTPKL